MVKVQEAENQIITDYEVYARRPNDSDLLVGLSRCIKHYWDARRIWWRRMPHSILPGTRPPRRQKASSAFAFPTVRPKART